MYNWLRSYKLVIGKPAHETSAYTYEKEIKVPEKPTTITVDAVTDPAGDIISISNLASEDNDIRGFTFSLKSSRGESKTSNSAENTTLSLANFSDDMKSVLTQEGCVVRVYAGYGEDIYLVYSGDVVSITPTTSGMDRVLSCKLKDGEIDNKNTVVNITYEDGISMATIVEDLANRFPSSTLGTVATEELKNKFPEGGYTCYGKLSNVFSKMCRRNGLTYNRFNGKISIRPEQLIQGTPDYLIVGRNTFTLTSEVIKSITPILDNKNKMTEQKNVKRGINLNTFLIDVNLGDFVEVPSEVSEEYEGTYKITKILTDLQSKGSSWDVTLKCEPM